MTEDIEKLLEDNNLIEILKVPYATKMYIERLHKELEQVKEDLETERMRLVGCSIAALSGEKALECLDKYKSASMYDTIQLYQKNTFWRNKAELIYVVLSNVFPEHNFGMKLLKEYEDTFIYPNHKPKEFRWLYKPTEETQWKEYDGLRTEFEMELMFRPMKNWEYKKMEEEK